MKPYSKQLELSNDITKRHRSKTNIESITNFYCDYLSLTTQPTKEGFLTYLNTTCGIKASTRTTVRDTLGLEHIFKTRNLPSFLESDKWSAPFVDFKTQDEKDQICNAPLCQYDENSVIKIWKLVMQYKNNGNKISINKIRAIIVNYKSTELNNW